MIPKVQRNPIHVTNVSKAQSVKPVQQPIRKGRPTRDLAALDNTHKAFIENLHFSEHIEGDVIILGQNEILPKFNTNRKVFNVSNVNEIKSQKISFLYVNIDTGSYDKTREVLEKTKNKMAWGGMYFIPSYQGYQGKTKFHTHTNSVNPGSQVWDEFIRENFFSTYSSKQRPLLPYYKNDTEDHFVIKYFRKPAKTKYSTKRISIATVFRTGGSYNESHVYHIYKSCKKNIKIPFDFYCLTDMNSNFSNAPIKKIPLVHNWPGYWSKIELFRPNVFQHNQEVLYLDLDTLITNDITDIASIRSKFFGMRDFNTLNLLSSAIMKFNPKDFTYIYDTFKSDPNRWMKCKGGDQEAIHKILRIIPDYIQDVFPRRMAEFLNHCWNPKDKNNPVTIEEHHSVVCFHGSPKMDDLLDNPIVKNYSYR